MCAHVIDKVCLSISCVYLIYLYYFINYFILFDLGVSLGSFYSFGSETAEEGMIGHERPQYTTNYKHLHHFKITMELMASKQTNISTKDRLKLQLSFSAVEI